MLGFDGCQPGAIGWIENYFHDCVYDIKDTVGFTLGLCSIFVWLTAQLPQFISNIKNQSSEALSIWFLVEWFAGDTLNLLGCLIQGQQLPTTTILAAYFVLVDVIMLLQYIYYGAVQARRKRLRAKAQRKRQQQQHHHHQHTGRSRDNTSNISTLRYPQQQHLLSDGTVAISIPGADYSFADTSTNATSWPAGPSPLLSPTIQSPSPAITGNRSAGAAGHVAAGGANAAGDAAGTLRNAVAAATAGLSIVCVAALVLTPSSRVSPPLWGTSSSAAAAAGSLLSQPHLSSSLGDPVLRRTLLQQPQQHSLGGEGVLGTDLGPLLGLGGEEGEGAAEVGLGVAFRSKWWHSQCPFLNCDWALVAGTAMGYLSTCFYLASRISQIRKNQQRKSTEGLSAVMFVMTMSANMCTGLSIVIRLRTLEQLKEQLPWMCGTFGTIALDATLLGQVLTLGRGGGGHPQGPQGHGQHGTPHGSSRTSHGHGHGTASAAVGPRNGSGGGHGEGCRGGCGNGYGVVAVADGGAGGGGEGGGKVSDLEAPLLGPQAGAEGEQPVGPERNGE